MRNLLKMLAVVGLVAVSGSAAQAQGFKLQIGVDEGPRRIESRVVRDVDYDRPVVSRRVIRDVEYDRPIVSRRVIQRDVDYVRPVVSRRVIERRIVRPAPVRTVCRTVIRERVRPNGVVVRRPTELCRQVVAGRRTYID